MFHSFLSYNSKQYSATTSAHSKQIIELLKYSMFLDAGHSTIWDNTEGCAEHYRWAIALYLFLILLQSFNKIICRRISAPGNGREVVDVLNYTYKRFIFQLMDTIQLPGSEHFDTWIVAYTAIQITYISSAPEFQRHLSNALWRHNILDHDKHKNKSSKKIGQT